MDFKDLIPLLLQGGGKLVDVLVDGSKIGTDGVKGLQMAYAACLIYGKDWVASSETELDDKGLDAVMNAIEDLAEEGGFLLPAI